VPAARGDDVGVEIADERRAAELPSKPVSEARKIVPYCRRVLALAARP
jgi:hypothetical protein